MKWIAILCLIALAACSESKQSEVGKFVYCDAYNCLHTRLDCPSLTGEAKTKDERMRLRLGVDFIDTCELKVNFNFCQRCVDDKAYIKLSRIIERNKGED